MPPPQPSLSLSRVSATSFSASVSGGSVSATHTLYYRKAGASSDTTGPSLVGNGGLGTMSGLSANATYQAWAVGLEGGSYSLPGFAYVSLAQPETLAAGLHAHFNGSAALTAGVTGGMWTGEVPEGTAPPYVWLDVQEVRQVPNFVDQLEYARVFAHLYGLGAEQTETMAYRFKGHFDYGELSISGVDCVALLPTTYRLVSEAMRHRDGRLVFRAVMGYNAILQRPR